MTFTGRNLPQISPKGIPRRAFMPWVTAVFFVFLVVFPQVASAQEAKTVRASGMAVIFAGDVAQAREKAIDDALKHALEQAVGLLVESETIVENFQLIEDNVYSKTKGYVQSYNIISEGKKDDGTFEVSVEAVVKTGSLQNDLKGIGVLLKRKNMPRVMVIMEEDHSGKTAREPSSENEINRKLVEKEFKVVDKRQVAKIRESEKMEAALSGDVGALKSIGSQTGAEILIIGEASSEEASVGGLGGLVSCRGRVEAKALKADTGEIIATDARSASAVDIVAQEAGKKAVVKASSQLADSLLAKVVNRWSEELSAGTTVRLALHKVKSLAELNQFKGFLRSYIGKITAINQREFSGTDANLDITIRGDGHDLARELSEKEVEGFTVTVTKATAHRVDADIAKK
ncbi:MAG: flagellar assembly protein T N-terminal domain-containing protein [Candidatus Eisenbacteria bacterium]|nr:flagellar assembly protein T N-terminal domain-containing protein [Candidatus Eisenbacteria bacterium]